MISTSVSHFYTVGGVAQARAVPNKEIGLGSLVGAGPAPTERSYRCLLLYVPLSGVSLSGNSGEPVALLCTL